MKTIKIKNYKNYNKKDKNDITDNLILIKKLLNLTLH